MAYTIISQNNTTTTLSDENGNVITVPARVTLATSTDYTITKVNNNSVDLESSDGKIIRGVPACVVLAGEGGGGGGGNYLPLTGGTVTGNITVSQSTDWSNILTLGCGSNTTKYWNVSAGTVGSGGSAFGRLNIQENKVNGVRYDFDYERFNVNKDNVVSIGGPYSKFKAIYAKKINNGANIDIPTTGGTMVVATPPSADGTYVLKATVADGVVTTTWVAE